ncbi:MAG: glycosyltransferase family 4 protein [Rubrobacteraceae bacterium]
MRIVFFAETFLPATDGVVTRLRYTIEELQKMGDEMLVIAPRYGHGPGSYMGVPIHRVAAVPLPVYPQFMLAPTNLGVGKALRSFRPDLIHAVNPFILGWGAPLYARRLRVPLVASYHTNVATYAGYYGLGRFNSLTRRYTRWLHNKADINLCTSEATRVHLKKEGIERVCLWPQGVDTQRFRPDRYSEKRRAKLSAGHPEDRLLIYVGRLGREKGIGSLKAILGRVSGARLVIVGDGPARRELERKFAGTPTVFAGLLHGKQLARAYASADVFVFPSTTETLGMAMIEALSSGLPVIAARSGATHEVVEDGRTGILYDPGSEDSLVSAVRKLTSDFELHERFSLAARASAEQRGWDNATRTLRGYYETALRTGASVA